MNSDGTYSIVLELASGQQCCKPATVGGNGVVFSFKVKNPSLPQPHSVATVEANGIKVVETSMREHIGANRPMSIAKTQLTASVNQSTDLPCQTNTITVKLRGTKIAEACNAKITIKGLLAEVYQLPTRTYKFDNTTNTTN